MKRKGYSLLELVIVITISAILFISTAVVIGDQIEANKIKATQMKIDTLMQALENYRLKHNALPCPALLTASEGSAQYAVAQSGCADTCPSGLTCSGNFVSGAIPTSDLELGINVSIDDWNDKIAYSVDRRFTNTGTCQVDGSLTVNHTEGGVTNTLSTAAAYVLVSYGKDGFGAYDTNGSLKASCASGMLQTENCNNDYIFTTSDINKPTDASIYYDDIVGWQPNNALKRCPQGVEDCALWLDAADICSIDYQGSLHEVASWADKSLNGYSAVSSGSAPTFDPATYYNNHPYISFGGSHLLSINGSSLPPSTDFTQIVVFKTTNNSDAVITAAADGSSYVANSNRQLGLQNSGKAAFSISSGTTIQSNAQCGTSSPYCADGIAHIATVQVDSAKGHTLYLDGVVDASSPTTSATLSGQSHMLIGGNSSWGYYTGDLLEVILYNRVLSLNEMKAIELYLAAKWNISKYQP